MRQGKSWIGRLGATAALAALLTAAGATMTPGARAAEEPPLQGRFGAAFTMAEEPYPAPDVSFRNRDGEVVSLADFEGRVVLLNLWATWCGPCVEEMPTLDALAAGLRDEGLTVLAVSQDHGGRSVVEPFLRDEMQLDAVDIYLDPEGALSRTFSIRGLPTTYLIDAHGRVVGGMEGAADWNSEAARALVRHYLKQGRADDAIQTGG